MIKDENVTVYPDYWAYWISEVAHEIFMYQWIYDSTIYLNELKEKAEKTSAAHG